MESPSTSDNKAIELVETLATVVEEAIKITESAEPKEASQTKDSSEIRNEVAAIELKAEEAVKAVEAKAADKAEDIQKILVTIKDDEDKLSAEQKVIIKSVYEKVKESIETILNAKDVESAIKITQTIATVIKLLEKFSVGNKPISGASKKLIALELVRTLISDLVKDESIKNNILAMYDTIGESTLETLVDVSRNLNVKEAADAAATCCVGFFSLFSKKSAK
jgi:hypothetical protein